MNSKNKQFIDDKMAGKVIDAVDFALGKRITDILGRQCSKDMIRFNSVGTECGKVREQKDLSIKVVSAQMKAKPLPKIFKSIKIEIGED